MISQFTCAHVCYLSSHSCSTSQCSVAAAIEAASAGALSQPLCAPQVRADCPPARLLEFLCSEAGAAVDRAAEQVCATPGSPRPCACGRVGTSLEASARTLLVS